MARRPAAARRVALGALAGAIAAAIAAVIVLAWPSAARADDEFDGASVIFARGASLYRVDPLGKGETEVAQLPSGATVRALRSDARGTVLLADLAGAWAWMPLDGSTRTLTDLPCGDGPAALADDGSAVLCRSPRQPHQSILVELGAPGPGGPGGPRVTALDVPAGAARLVGSGAERKLVWADQAGVWTAPATDPRRKTRAALDPPLRGFLPSPDGARAIAVYADQVFADRHHKRSAEVLMTLQLDGQGARRKAIRDGVAVEWSHDGSWLLVQDGASTCIMRVSGGQYKCWRGLTAVSLSADGRWALALGNRDGSRSGKSGKSGKSAKPAKSAKSAKSAAKPAPPPAHPAARRPPPRDADPPGPDDKPWDHIDEPSDEPEAGDPPAANDDVSVAVPSGPLSLYRLRLEGAFTDRPTLLVKIVDGAAVWVPGSP